MLRRHVIQSAEHGGGLTGRSAGAGSSASAAPAAAKVRLQLQWYPQAQFAGYFAAKEQGYYDAAGIDLTIVDGSARLAPQTVGSAPNGPEFTLAWVPKVLQAREAGSDLVDIAQIFQRSGTLSVSWKDNEHHDAGEFKGKKIGVWDFGNEYEVTSGAKKAGLEQGTDYTKDIQDFNMSALLAREIDVSEAMIYNEYAQVLEAKTPRPVSSTSRPTSTSSTGTTSAARCSRTPSSRARRGSRSRATRTSRSASCKATFQGWIYCRANPDDCIQYTVNAGPRSARATSAG